MQFLSSPCNPKTNAAKSCRFICSILSWSLRVIFILCLIYLLHLPSCCCSLWLESEGLFPTAPSLCSIKLCFCFCESPCVVRLNWWLDPVTHIPFHSAGTERKREGQKGVKVRVREREREQVSQRPGETGGEGERGRKPRDICSWVDEHRQSLAHSSLSVMLTTPSLSLFVPFTACHPPFSLPHPVASLLWTSGVRLPL